MPGLRGASYDDNNRIQLIRQAAILPSQPHKSLEQAVFEHIDPDAQFVLIGEASHGTEEFYRMRAELTKMLIKQRGFHAVVVEADFPDAFRVNMYARGLGEDRSAEEALRDFTRFPTWMWRNTVMLDFVRDLREHNDAIPPDGRERAGVGFYGMDLYSLHASAHKVVDYLCQVDPEAASRAAKRYQCFDRYGADTMAYAMAVGMRGAPGCADAAVGTLLELLRREAEYAPRLDGLLGEELAFQAKANAAVVKGAEGYYRNMFFGSDTTWNIRDSHFLSAVQMIAEHLEKRVTGPAKLILWAHNSHLGDARATDMGQRRGELNIGQLMRERYGEARVFNIGFTTHTGSVSAADEWDAPVARTAVRKSLPGSFEHLFHKADLAPEFALDFRRPPCPDLREALAGPLLERAIGVIYRPQASAAQQASGAPAAMAPLLTSLPHLARCCCLWHIQTTERQSHYFYAELSQQFDLVVHIDATTALRPLEPTEAWAYDWARQDTSETFPFGE
eukprot:scaffold2.g7234.t1